MTKNKSVSAVKAVDLAIGYNGKALFPAFSFELRPGTFNVVIGENGSGKSTLLHTIGGNLKPVAGRVEAGGVDVNRASAREIARTISLVYTDRLVSGGLTVREVVEMGRHPHTGFLGRLGAEDRVIVESAMNSVGIMHKSDSFLADVSDGERQKTMIARALAQETPVLMLDEPTNFLDAASRMEIMQLIRQLVDEKHLTAIVSTHDTATALVHADSVLTILPDDARAVSVDACGTPEAFDRLDKVFASRGIGFDVSRNDFVMRKH